MLLVIRVQFAKAAGLVVFAAAILIAAVPKPVMGDTADYKTGDVEADFFEGRWAFAEETCDLPTNWTLQADGNFVSEDLTGVWQWADGRLTLNLVDLAVDMETGEAGGRFRMDGPAQISGADQFIFVIEPDRYVLKRCE